MSSYGDNSVVFYCTAAQLMCNHNPIRFIIIFKISKTNVNTKDKLQKEPVKVTEVTKL